MKITQAEIDRMIENEILKESKSENINESANEKPVTKAIRKILGEALLGECTPIDNTNNDPYRNCPKKYQKARKLIDMIHSMIMRIIDVYYIPMRHETEDDDNEIKDMMTNSMSLILGKAINKLQILWNSEEKSEPISASPDDGTVVIVKGDEIVSPQEIEYKVEDIQGNEVILKEIKSNNMVTVTKNIARKWKSKE